MKKIIFHEGARKDYIDSLLFYKNQSRGALQKFQKEFLQLRKRIKRFPRIGYAGQAEMRRLPFPTFPFSLIYLIEQDALYLIAVAHHSRHPEYWKNRVRKID